MPPAPIDNIPEKADTTESGLPLLDPALLADMQKLMKRKFDAVVHLYLEDTEHRLAMIEEMIGVHGKGRDIARQAHSVRSTSHYFGAMRLAGIAETLEIIAPDEKNSADEKVGIAPLFIAVKQAFEATRPLLLKHVEKSAA